MDRVPVLQKADNLSQEEVITWLKQLRGHPYVAQSGFDVTSIFKLKANGATYYAAGVNVENRDLTAGTCAEEGAIAAAIAAFGHHIEINEGWVMGAPTGAKASDIACYPCGECRQRISQYAVSDALIHMVTLAGEVKDTRICAELLPEAFSFRDLEHVSEHEQARGVPVAENAADRLYRIPDHSLTQSQIVNWLAELRGDARVSNYHQATIWRLSNGAYSAGVAIENAAYPSSTNVMACAAAIMHAHFGQQIVEEVWMHGFCMALDKQSSGLSDYYTPSGVSLQILGQFVRSPAIKLHRLNGLGEYGTITFGEALAFACMFGN